MAQLISVKNHNSFTAKLATTVKKVKRLAGTVFSEAKDSPRGGKERPSRGRFFKNVKVWMPFCFERNMSRTSTSSRVFFGIIISTRILAGILFCSTLHNPALAFNAPPQASSYSLTLTWDPSPSPEVVGYRLYYGAESGNYTNSIVTSNVTTATISGLLMGINYYFAITAIAGDGQESDFSNEVSYTKELPGAKLQIRGASNGQFVLTAAGLDGHTYDIEATEDFSSWTVIGTVTVGPSGSEDFTDTNAANFPQRFYRMRDVQASGQQSPPVQTQIRAVSGGQFVLTVVGLPGHTYDIEATEDFSTWAVIGTVIVGVSGSQDFTDANAANYPQRFYRTHDTQL
jgi:hypothetical protein